jgi:predicted ArsR family transcriptional regulator
MFSFIRRARRAVTREEAAETIGISRKLAAFHLDKMVAAGLLRARYEATGDEPKVGRRPKVYEAAPADISLSIPVRRYQLLADLLLDTVLRESSEETGQEAATRTARERGVAFGASQQAALEPDADASAALPLCGAMLEAHGYEPVAEGASELRLRNCPFHPLAAKASDLVCSMNQAFLAGCLEGLRITSLEARLEPTPDECCVRIAATA